MRVRQDPQSGEMLPVFEEAPSLAVLSTARLEGCREAFVKTIKDENVLRDFSKWSLRAHWSGASGGFADEQLQRRWHDFVAGWLAASQRSNTNSGA
jgi:hypothetical protein